MVGAEAQLGQVCLAYSLESLKSLSGAGLSRQRSICENKHSLSVTGSPTGESDSFYHHETI